MEVDPIVAQLQRLVEGCANQETNIADIPHVGNREYHAALAQVVREIFDDNMPIPPDPAKQAKDNSDYEQLMKQSIVGGPAIIFTRLMQLGMEIRTDLYAKLCQIIIGFDCVSICSRGGLAFGVAFCVWCLPFVVELACFVLSSGCSVHMHTHTCIQTNKQTHTK
jgi:hypothetical protein